MTRTPRIRQSPVIIKGHEETQNASIPEASLWMIGISLLLFFLPALNGLIGGLVGGYKAGSVKRGVTAAVLPLIIVALGLWALLALMDLPLLGLFAGLAVGVWIALADLGLLIGAFIGGYFSDLPRSVQRVESA